MGVIGSHGGHFFWVRYLKGAEGVTPPKISKIFLPNVAQTPYPKSQTIRNHVSYVTSTKFVHRCVSLSKVKIC